MNHVEYLLCETFNPKTLKGVGFPLFRLAKSPVDNYLDIVDGCQRFDWLLISLFFSIFALS